MDSERKPILGNPANAEHGNFKPIIHNGTTIGYLGIPSPKHFLSPHQMEFLKQQKLTLILAALCMALVVLDFSLPLSNHLVKPIKAMAVATHDLASGKYAIRIPVSSSYELGQLYFSRKRFWGCPSENPYPARVLSLSYSKMFFLKAIAQDFNSMALTLEKNEKERRQWVADISHELRTPLAVLRGEIEALLEGVRRTSPEAIRSLQAEVTRLQRLVEDLYQLSLSDLGTLTFHKQDHNLIEILEDSLATYRPEFTRKGIALTVDFPQKQKFMATNSKYHEPLPSGSLPYRWL